MPILDLDKILDTTWERARGTLRTDLEKIERAVNELSSVNTPNPRVSQPTSKSTAVRLDALRGQVLMNVQGVGAAVTFTLANNYIRTSSLVLVNLVDGQTIGAYTVGVDGVDEGQCNITLQNYSGGVLSETVVIGFVVI